MLLLVPDQNKLEAAPVAVGGLVGLEIKTSYQSGLQLDIIFAVN